MSRRARGRGSDKAREAGSRASGSSTDRVTFDYGIHCGSANAPPTCEIRSLSPDFFLTFVVVLSAVCLTLLDDSRW